MSDLQQHIGRNVYDVKTELEQQGYNVHLVRTGNHATGFVPPQPLSPPDQDLPKKRIVLTYDANNQDQVTSAQER
ncbi:unnamed protein product [Didymodactylos carnosus]|uniref:PASTA domain-containing protein n=1 Tax=Didymodactylos carnosus TaxID=1234261 RepID=A0A814KBZ6_9BILA|nr:unnamed protein product [Didymodactylos carnosus]CAF1323507.1 unnamed protein product [Didymodactylos carnosus]CAF3819089.1 unnamed protein product [Didymodactylos carnosus]CAF4134019.1 unnamed protein product [Didymodactylos carnosus]